MDSLEGQGSRIWFSRRNVGFGALVIAMIIIGVLWTLGAKGIISEDWPIILTVVVSLVGTVVTILALFLSSNQSKLLQVSLSQQLPKLRSLVGQPPFVQFGSVCQRENAVDELYQILSQPSNTAIVLTGMCGIGKSMLAALICSKVEQYLGGPSRFSAPPLWIEIDAHVTIVELAESVCKALGKVLPENFPLFAPRDQAEVLFNALNTADAARLIVLDQFDLLLDGQTGHACTDRPGIGEWLDQLNGRRCKCVLLLTSRFWPKGTHMSSPSHIQEYRVENLEMDEGKKLFGELLKQCQVEERPEDEDVRVNAIVNCCEKNVLALTELPILLRRRQLKLIDLLDDPTHAQFWMGDIICYRFDPVIRQLNQVQRRLLFAFSICSKPIPLQAIQILKNFASEQSATELRSALDVLLAQHLLQASGKNCYKVPAVVANYAQSRLMERDKLSNQQVLWTTHI